MNALRGKISATSNASVLFCARLKNMRGINREYAIYKLYSGRKPANLKPGEYFRI